MEEEEYDDEEEEEEEDDDEKGRVLPWQYITGGSSYA